MLCIDELVDILDAGKKAGLVHLDGRLANFVICDAMVKVKLIDWDNCTIPAVIVACAGDDRYPSGAAHASEAVHNFFSTRSSMN